MSPRIKSLHWLDAYRARLSAHFIPCYIVKKGDPDAGAVFIRINDTTLYAPEYSFEADARQWQIVAENENIEAYLQKQSQFDPDYWLMDVEAGGEAHLFNEGL